MQICTSQNFCIKTLNKILRSAFYLVTVKMHALVLTSRLDLISFFFHSFDGYDSHVSKKIFISVVYLPFPIF